MSKRVHKVKRWDFPLVECTFCGKTRVRLGALNVGYEDGTTERYPACAECLDDLRAMGPDVVRDMIDGVWQELEDEDAALEEAAAR